MMQYTGEERPRRIRRAKVRTIKSITPAQAETARVAFNNAWLEADAQAGDGERLATSRSRAGITAAFDSIGIKVRDERRAHYSKRRFGLFILLIVATVALVDGAVIFHQDWPVVFAIVTCFFAIDLFLDERRRTRK